MDDPTPTPPAPELIKVYFSSGATGGTAVCVVKTGYYSGLTLLKSAVAASLTLPAGGGGQVDWDETLLIRPNISDAVTMNCRVPGSWRLGLIPYRTAA